MYAKEELLPSRMPILYSNHLEGSENNT